VRHLLAVALAAALLGCSGAPIEAQVRSGGNKAGFFSPASATSEGAAPVAVLPEVLEGWTFLYNNITDVEFVLCLEGQERNGVIVIDGFRLARMEEATKTSVRYHPCAGDRYVGTAHNHPPTGEGGSLCYRSMPDRRSFEADHRAIVDVVLCGTDKYIWVLKDGSTGGPGSTH